MNKISLRWRITLLMGALLLSVCVLLTALSIQNMTSKFVAPILNLPVETAQPDVTGEGNDVLSFDQPATNLPEGMVYMPEIKQGIAAAGRSFSLSSYLSLALVVVGGMLAAYYLAGRAMRPIAELRDEIGAIGGNDLSKRIGVPQTKDEMEALARSFNELLTRLERDFEKEKRFSANAAHELKTPLATIMTSAQVLAMDPTSSIADHREYLDVTLQSVRRLSRVVDGLLLLGGASLDAPFEAVDLAQMLDEIEQELAPLYDEKNIALSHDLQPVALHGDPVLLYRAFFNLMENAMKYAGDHGAVTVASRSDDEGCVICISNTGGIPADDIQNIFEPFYRADKSRSRKIAGAGLGLSIAKEIFDLHQASITISSDHGAETVVEVRFCR